MTIHPNISMLQRQPFPDNDVEIHRGFALYEEGGEIQISAREAAQSHQSGTAHIAPYQTPSPRAMSSSDLLYQIM